MKFIPIIFNSEMVTSILTGTKTQTRRTDGLNVYNKPGDEPKGEEDPGRWFYAGIKDNILYMECLDSFESYETNLPYKKDDILWVREKFQLVTPYGPEDYFFGYADGSYSQNEASEKYDFCSPYQWKPSIHMPKEACRLFLRVTDVRLERLNEISEKDAKAEGIERLEAGLFWWKNYLNSPLPGVNTAKESFKTLWISLYKKNSWDLNPWVWVITFERISKPQNFLP